MWDPDASQPYMPTWSSTLLGKEAPHGSKHGSWGREREEKKGGGTVATLIVVISRAIAINATSTLSLQISEPMENLSLAYNGGGKGESPNI